MDTSVDRQQRYLDKRFYADAARWRELLVAVGTDVDLHVRAGYDPVDGLVRQLNPQTATWAIDLLENQFGLPNLVEATVETRRERILSLIRSGGTMTAYRAEQVANAFQNGDVLIDPDFEKYTVYVWFVNQLGNPPNLEAMLAGLRRAYPGHIAIQPIIVYSDWNDLDAPMLTWNALDALALTEDELPTTVF